MFPPFGTSPEVCSAKENELSNSALSAETLTCSHFDTAIESAGALTVQKNDVQSQYELLGHIRFLLLPLSVQIN
jgi:hypothetical protein